MKNVGHYQIIRAIENNLQGISYEGIDSLTNERVILYEFLPTRVAYRVEGSDSVAPYEGKRVIYKYLCEDFIELFTILSELPPCYHSVAPHCKNIIRCNNTVYGVVDEWQGETLEDFLARQGGKLSWSAFSEMIKPVMELLSYLHRSGRLHRGVCPENLVVNGDGKLMLCGFVIPAARTAGSEIGAKLYPNFSAPEQFRPSGWQSEATDVYGFAACCYRALTGVSVVAAQQRKDRDLAIFLSEDIEIPPAVLPALQRGLSLEQSDRPQTIRILWEEMTGLREPPPKPEIKLPAPLLSMRHIDLLTVLFVIFILVIGMFWLIHFLTYEEMPEIFPPSSTVESSSEGEPTPESTAPHFVGRYVESVLSSYQGEYVLIPEWTFDEVYPYGVILEQDVHGADALGRPQIWLLVSRGSEWIEMPDVIGKTEKVASEILTAMDIPFEILPMIDVTTRSGTIIEANFEKGASFSRKQEKVILYSAR